MVYDILENSIVVRSIVADEQYMLDNYEPSQYKLADHQPIDDVNSIFGKKITRLAFLNRFTDAEAVAIDLASIGATPEAASIRLYLKKVDAATYIDLDDASTRSGVQALETIGLLGTGRALEILDAPIQSTERP